MKVKEVFAQFFTNLLKLDDRGTAREIAKTVWPGTREIWLHTLKIDPVLIELDLARVTEEGGVVYRPPDPKGWTPWEQEISHGDPRNPVVYLEDHTRVAWSVLKYNAKTRDIFFQMPDDKTGTSFWLGPDIFPDSYRLCWMTAAEKEGGPDAYQDHRVRSSEPDDFLSRINHLVSGSDEPFVPKF